MGQEQLRKQSIADHYDTDASAYHRRFYIQQDVYRPLGYRQLYIEKMIAAVAPPRAAVLDVGCGPGELILSLIKNGYDAHGIDISTGMVTEAESLLLANGFGGQNRIRVGDIEHLDCPDESYDIVIASGVIEYQQTDEPSLREMSRVLRPGGHVILNVTNRYTYLRLLEHPYTWLRHIPGTATLLEAIKDRWLRRGKLHAIPDRRVHSPKMFDRILESYGLAKIDYNYFHFSPLPPPLTTVFFRLCNRTGKRMESLTRHSAAPWLAGGYLVMARKITK